LELTAGEAGIAADWLNRVREMPGVKSASPVVDRVVRPVSSNGYGQQIYLVGIDLLYDRDPRDFSVSRSGYLQRDLASFSRQPNAIALPAELAAELGVSEGQTLRVHDVDHDLVFTVEGTLIGSLANAWSGRIAIGDFRAVQRALATDKLSRIDLMLEPSYARAAFVSNLQGQLGSEGSVRSAKSPNRYLDGMMDAYLTGVWAVVLVGVIIALLVSFCISTDVVQRRAEEFRLLRSVGMNYARLRWLVVLEAMLLAILSSACGLLVSSAVAGQFVAAFSMVSHAIGGFKVELQQIAGMTVLIGCLTAGVIVVVSSIAPALRAARQAEGSSEAWIDGGRQLGARAALWARYVAIGGAGILGFALVGSGIDNELLRVDLGIVGGVVCVGAASCWMFARPRRAAALLHRVVPRVGYLVVGLLRDRPVELASVVTIWATAVGGVAAIVGALAGAGAGIRDVNGGWRGPTAINGMPDEPERVVAFRPAGADPGVLERIASTEGVESAVGYKARRIVYRGEDVFLFSVPTKSLVAHGGLKSVSEDPRESIAALERGECLVSWVLVDRFGIKIGDEISIPTEDGVERCRVGGRGISFRGGVGAIYVDDQSFDRWFDKVGIYMIDLWLTELAESAVPRLKERAQPERLSFSFGLELDRLPMQILGMWSRYVAITFVAFPAIGFLGLLTVLVGMMPGEQVRFVSTIRLVGGTRRTVMAVLVARSVLISALGSAAGIVFGSAWAYVFVAAVHRTFGWDHPWGIDLFAVSEVCIIAFVLSVVVSTAAALAVGRRTLARG
jgi:putative ABC transport system permease protein